MPAIDAPAPGDLIVATTEVTEDEPCLGLHEINLQSPGSKGFHRYQIAYVMRADRPAARFVDLGAARKFKAPQFRIPGGAKDPITGRYKIVHTVGQLRDIADDIRAKRADLLADPNPVDFRQQLIDQSEQVRLLHRRASTSGPHITVQRSA